MYVVLYTEFACNSIQTDTNKKSKPAIEQVEQAMSNAIMNAIMQCQQSK